MFLMWVGLEMNLLAIIPLIISKHHPRSTEAASKYFVTQATASIILLLSIVLNFKQLGVWYIQSQTNYIITSIILISLAIKLGLAPFHSWLPEVTQGIKPSTGLILLTWQKLAPLSILFQIYEFLDLNLIISIALISIFIGAWNGLNQTQLRKIIAYSSIAHIGWIISVCPYNPNLTIINLIIYILLTAPIFIVINIYYTSSISSISIIWNKIPIILPIVSIILLSIGGLPPLTGFIPKWLIIYELLKNNCIMLATAISMIALINLFFYTRIIYSTSLTMFPTNNNSKILIIFLTKKVNTTMAPLAALSTLILPLTSILSNQGFRIRRLVLEPSKF